MIPEITLHPATLRAAVEVDTVPFRTFAVLSKSWRTIGPVEKVAVETIEKVKLGDVPPIVQDHRL
jgi:hypothetical protein